MFAGAAAGCTASVSHLTRSAHRRRQCLAHSQASHAQRGPAAVDSLPLLLPPLLPHLPHLPLRLPLHNHCSQKPRDSSAVHESPMIWARQPTGLICLVLFHQEEDRDFPREEKAAQISSLIDQ